MQPQSYLQLITLLLLEVVLAAVERARILVPVLAE
jgi:hypothetical protein